MKVSCPCCGEALIIEAHKGQFRAVKTADREALPAITVENLEHTALRTAERDDHGIGRAAWTAENGSTFIVTVREGNPFIYRIRYCHQVEGYVATREQLSEILKETQQ